MNNTPSQDEERPLPPPNDLREIAKLEQKELGHSLNVMGEIYNEYSPEEGGALSEGIEQQKEEIREENEA